MTGWAAQPAVWGRGSPAAASGFLRDGLPASGSAEDGAPLSGTSWDGPAASGTSRGRPAVSVNVRGSPRSVGPMTDTAAWAENTARRILKASLPRRWAHTQQVAAAARTLAPVLGRDADLVTAAAWLHDIGYAPALGGTGFHPLDGARHLRDTEHAAGILCRLVAHHSCAQIEAEERGIGADLVREFHPAPPALADAVIYCDMTTGPDGQRLPVEQRLAEILARYGPSDLVSRSITRSAPLLTAAVTRVTQQLDPAAPAPGRHPEGRALVLAAAV